MLTLLQKQFCVNTRTPDPGVMNFTVLVKASLLILITHNSMTARWLVAVEKIFKELMHIHCMTNRALPLHHSL